jgi:hypothetical protein
MVSVMVLTFVRVNAVFEMKVKETSHKAAAVARAPPREKCQGAQNSLLSYSDKFLHEYLAVAGIAGEPEVRPFWSAGRNPCPEASVRSKSKSGYFVKKRNR